MTKDSDRQPWQTPEYSCITVSVWCVPTAGRRPIRTALLFVRWLLLSLSLSSSASHMVQCLKSMSYLVPFHRIVTLSFWFNDTVGEISTQSILTEPLKTDGFCVKRTRLAIWLWSRKYDNNWLFIVCHLGLRKSGHFPSVLRHRWSRVTGRASGLQSFSHRQSPNVVLWMIEWPVESRPA